MSLTPNNQTELLDVFLQAETEMRSQPAKTYRLNFGNGRLGGMVDGEQAMRQFVVKAVLTNRSHYSIYSDDFGCEIEQLIGNDVTESFIQAEIPRMVREALIYDDRVNEVIDVKVSRQGDAFFIVATIDSIYGNVTQEVTI